MTTATDPLYGLEKCRKSKRADADVGHPLLWDIAVDTGGLRRLGTIRYQ